MSKEVPGGPRRSVDLHGGPRRLRGGPQRSMVVLNYKKKFRKIFLFKLRIFYLFLIKKNKTTSAEGLSSLRGSTGRPPLPPWICRGTLVCLSGGNRGVNLQCHRVLRFLSENLQKLPEERLECQPSYYSWPSSVSFLFLDYR